MAWNSLLTSRIRRWASTASKLHWKVLFSVYARSELQAFAKMRYINLLLLDLVPQLRKSQSTFIFPFTRSTANYTLNHLLSQDQPGKFIRPDGQLQEFQTWWLGEYLTELVSSLWHTIQYNVTMISFRNQTLKRQDDDLS